MLSAIFFILGLIALIVGAELLVRGASQLAFRFGMSPLIVGVTVVAFGTSSPELAVTILSGWKQQTDLAVGNVVGSNIFNVLMILGASALVFPLKVANQLVRIDVPIMILASLILLFLAWDHELSLLNASFLLLLMLGYLLVTIFIAKRTAGQDMAINPPKSGKLIKDIFQISIGIALLVAGSQAIVEAAITAAKAMGVSELLIGLTIIAAGTSLPELATSIMASIRKEADIAVGNIVGSCIFNVLGILSVAGFASGGGLLVPELVRQVDLPIMLATAFVCLPIFFSGFVVSRTEGAVFLLGYFVYLAFVIWHNLNPAKLSPAQLGQWAGIGVLGFLTITFVLTIWPRLARRAA